MNSLMSFSKTVLLFLLLSAFLVGCESSTNEKKVGIIVPLEHKAMNEIVAGFTETLRTQYQQPIKIKVVNAQGDINLQRAMITQMKNDHYDLVVPISTATTQMSVSTIRNQPIVSLAASYSEEERKKQTLCNIVVVHDEISPEQIVSFIHQTYPQLKHATLIHSTSDKIFPDVKIAVATGKKMGIEIKPMMVSTLNELYSSAHAIPNDTQAIFILKDSLIASGISTLGTIAEKRGIPLITSDQGTVQEGALFAIGVHEREIGERGAKLAAEVLAGKPVCSLPNATMDKLTVFVNQQALVKEKQSIDPIQSAAKQNHYPIELVGQTS